MDSPARLAETVNNAYLAVHFSRLYVGLVGGMAGVSALISIQLLVAILGLANMTPSDSIATVELLLLAGLSFEIILITREAFINGVSVVQAMQFKPYMFDVMVLSAGLVFMTAFFLTTWSFVHFILNMLWIFPLTARSVFYFRLAWARATASASLPSNNPTTEVTKTSTRV